MTNSEMPEKISFLVAPEGPPSVRASIPRESAFLRYIARDKLSYIHRTLNDDIVELSDLLPVTDRSFRRLTSWHKVGPQADRITQTFEKAILRDSGKPLRGTPLGGILEAISELATGQGCDKTRMIIRVVDDRCVIPWEVLVCQGCHGVSGLFGPMVFRPEERCFSRRINACKALVGSFPKLTRVASPNCDGNVWELVNWSLDPDPARKPDWVADNYIIHNEVVERYRTRTTTAAFSVTSVGDLLRCVSSPPHAEIQILFACAAERGRIVLGGKDKVRSSDLPAQAASAAVMGIFPLRWGKTPRIGKPTIDWGKRALGFCKSPLLGVSTLFALIPQECAVIAAHLIGAGFKASTESQEVDPLSIAEPFIDWLYASGHSAVVGCLVLVGNLEIRTSHPPRLAVYKGSHNRLYQRCLELIEKRRFPELFDQLHSLGVPSETVGPLKIRHQNLLEADKLQAVTAVAREAEWEQYGLSMIKLVDDQLQRVLATLDVPEARAMAETCESTGLKPTGAATDGGIMVSELPGKPSKTVKLPAPSTECYAELAVQSKGEGMLRVLFTKHASSRPTEVGSIPIRDQPLEILLAGIEAAIKRIREAKEDSPTDRLPEECKIPLEWSADSLQGCVQGDANARRQAMGRLRNLVRFQNGAGLVSNQNVKNGTWESTIPFRFQTSGQT